MWDSTLRRALFLGDSMFREAINVARLYDKNNCNSHAYLKHYHSRALYCTIYLYCVLVLL
jgi:hypothetical protein